MADDPALILARHVWDTRFEQLPEEAVVAAKRDILDTLGAAIAGSGAPGIGELTKLARRWGGLEESSLLVLGGKLPAPQATLINAAMGHALDFDDTFDRAGHIHPGTSVLAASLAAAESVGKISSHEFLLAVKLGLDVSCRLALAAPVDRGWHRTAAFGVFGATAAAGKLMGLRESELVNAFGIAYSQAAGNRQCIVDGALTKRFQAGKAAHAGGLGRSIGQRRLHRRQGRFHRSVRVFPHVCSGRLRPRWHRRRPEVNFSGRRA